MKQPVKAPRVQPGRRPYSDDERQILVTLGERLADARCAARLRQHEVAERIGRDISFVSYVEAGKRSLTIPGLLDFAFAVGADPAALLEGL